MMYRTLFRKCARTLYPVPVLRTSSVLWSSKRLDNMAQKEEELKKRLTPLQYHVTQEKGTEQAFTGEYESNKEPGIYKCIVCGESLFKSEHKYNSGSGWPSFYETADKKVIEEHEDLSLGRQRTEVVCKKCKAHLGHVFPDGPAPTGLRYCINSASLSFENKGKEEL